MGSPSIHYTLYRNLSPACWTNIVFFFLFYFSTKKNLSFAQASSRTHIWRAKRFSCPHSLHTWYMKNDGIIHASMCTNHEHGVHTTRFTDKNPFSRSPLFTLYFFSSFFSVCVLFASHFNIYAVEHIGSRKPDTKFIICNLYSKSARS